MGKYKIIYADPPWSYPKTGGKKSSRGMAKQFYLTMTPDEISDLNVELIADENCVLFLWTTFPKIDEALKVIKTWGFTYHNAAFVWVKRTINDKDFVGMGYWARANPEICLLATRGKPKPDSHSVRQLTYAQVEKHSSKPHVFRDKIMELCGDVPRVELFAREKTEGWDVWGNEIDNDVSL